MKKIISAISVISVFGLSLLAVFSASADVSKYSLGDVDRDGNISVLDVTMLQTYIVENIT